jgi:predicted RNase H-like nuclease
MDGCRAGWVLATVAAESITGARPTVTVMADLSDLIADLDAGRVVAAGLDIPIGLPSSGPRQADQLARARLGRRKSSVFPAPARPVLAATTYDEACDLSRRASGVAISRQLFNILPKIREVDALQSPRRQEHLFEVHPELSFAELAGAPMPYAKRTPEGRATRIDALSAWFGGVHDLAASPPRGAQPDDVLDALVVLWTAQRYRAGRHFRLGGDVDETGLRTEVIG